MQQQQTFMLSFRFYPRNRHHMHCTAAHSDFFRVVRIIQHLKKSRVGWLPYIKILRIQDYSNNWVQTRLQIDAFKHSCSTLKWNDLANLYSRDFKTTNCARSWQIQFFILPTFNLSHLKIHLKPHLILVITKKPSFFIHMLEKSIIHFKTNFFPGIKKLRHRLLLLSWTLKNVTKIPFSWELLHK